MVQTVLGGAQGTADVGDIVDGLLDHVHSGLSTLLGGDVDAADAHGAGVHILDGDLQLVVAVGGVADLQGQAAAGGQTGAGSAVGAELVSSTSARSIAGQESGALDGAVKGNGDVGAGLVQQRVDLSGGVLLVSIQVEGNIAVNTGSGAFSTGRCVGHGDGAGVDAGLGSGEHQIGIAAVGVLQRGRTLGSSVSGVLNLSSVDLSNIAGA